MKGVIFLILFSLSITLEASVIDIPISYGDSASKADITLRIFYKKGQLKSVDLITSDVQKSINVLYGIFQTKAPSDSVFISLTKVKAENEIHGNVIQVEDILYTSKYVPSEILKWWIEGDPQLSIESNNILEQFYHYFPYIIIPTLRGYYSEIHTSLLVFNRVQIKDTVYRDKMISVFMFHNISEACNGRDSLLKYLNITYKEYKKISDSTLFLIIHKNSGKNLYPLFDHMKSTRKIPQLCLRTNKLEDSGELIYKWLNVSNDFEMPFKFVSHKIYFLWASGEERRVKLPKNEFYKFSYRTDFVFDGSKTIYEVIENDSCRAKVLEWDDRGSGGLGY